jgi:cell division protein FtsI/penicillin-binding protein 2
MSNQRHKILLFSLVSCFLLIGAKFFYWQIIKSPELREKALSQTYKLEKLFPTRGKIFSSDDFPLVLNQTNYQLSIYKPNLKDNLENIFSKINQVHLDFIKNNQTIVDNFKSNDNQKWITFNTPITESEKEQLDLPGLSFQKNQKRYYPEGQLGKDTIGIVGKNSQGLDIGYGGLEAYYNKQLQGKTGFNWGPQDGTGKTILTKKSWISPSIDGQNLHTTINRGIQYLVEQTLTDGVKKYNADSGSITIMDSQTGGLIAMSSIVATSSATPSAIRNSAISDLFEPGSIFKPLVVAMALDKKIIDTSYICDQCSHPRTIGEYTITNHDNATHPNSTLQDIIKNSDNIGMSYIMSKLGLKNFLEYYQKLGLNQKTGIDLQGEAKPTVKSVWPEIDLATASFGQGIVVTQINMLKAFNTLANNGSPIKPHVLDYFSDESNNKFYFKTSSPNQIFSQQSISDIKSILKYSVENGVVAQFKPKDLEVCAKSGTAQVAVKGSYTDSATIASYIGFSPCDNPKFTMIVTINNPKSSPWGSSTAAPIWFELASKIVHLL